MSASQKIILTIFVIYLALNAIIGIVFSKRQGSKQNVSSEKKFFIGGRNMNGLLLAMTTMATYTSVSSFISGPGAAGLTYGYAQKGASPQHPLCRCYSDSIPDPERYIPYVPPYFVTINMGYKYLTVLAVRYPIPLHASSGLPL